MAKVHQNIPIPDELDLLANITPDIPSDLLFPDELTDFLKNQIKYLAHENGMLQKTLFEKEAEQQRLTTAHEGLQKKLRTLEMVTVDPERTFPQTKINDLAAQKIVELSKKVREKTSDLECLKTKCSRLENRVKLLEKMEVGSEKESITPSEAQGEGAENEIETLRDQTKQLHEKLNVTTTKLHESKNASMQLRSDLKAATRLLQQEIGSSFVTLQDFLQNHKANSTGWKGRSQQILALQQRNSELVEKINDLSEKGTSQLSIQKQQDMARKQQIEHLEKELQQSRASIEELNKKLGASRARTKVLEAECVSLRSKLTSQQDKAIHDEQLIKALTDQIGSAESIHSELIREKEAFWKKIEAENKSLKIEVAKEKCKLENLEKSTEEKENEIKELKKRLQSAQTKGAFRTSSILQLQSQPEKNINLETAERKRLMELVAVLNERLETERDTATETHKKFLKERQKAAKLETKLARLELETSMHKPGGYSSRSNVSKTFVETNRSSEVSTIEVENLKNGLELAQETILALKTRVHILQKEKHMDLQHFSTILEESKLQKGMHIQTNAGFFQ